MTRRPPLSPLAKILLLVIVLFAAIGTFLFVRSNQSQERQDRQAEQLTKVIGQLQQQDAQQECSRANDRVAFSAILASLADNFATAPYPDPGRQDAVQKMRDLAKFFATPQPVNACAPKGT